MSIREWLNGHVDDGTLRDIDSIDGRQRRLLVVPEIYDLFLGPWSDNDWAKRCALLNVSLQQFVAGGHISVSETPFEAGNAFLGILNPPSDGIWDIRSLSPSPSLRILGAFAAEDTFVGLLIAARSKPVPALSWGPLEDRNSLEWRRAIRAARVVWRRLFGEFQPVKGGANELVSEPFDIV